MTPCWVRMWPRSSTIGSAMKSSSPMVSDASFAQHKDKPFRVAGILQRTGTPVDRTVHVSLEAITAIHLDWQTGMQAPVGSRVSADAARHRDLTPDSITAFILGMKSKVTVFLMQRAINEYAEEPLLAIIPGVALQQFWSLVGWPIKRSGYRRLCRARRTSRHAHRHLDESR